MPKRKLIGIVAIAVAAAALALWWVNRSQHAGMKEHGGEDTTQEHGGKEHGGQ